MLLQAALFGLGLVTAGDLAGPSIERPRSRPPDGLPPKTQEFDLLGSPCATIDLVGQAARPMTIGVLSRRTGVPVKVLRTYEDLGLIYTVGRSAGNYRLFGDEALWCVRVVGGLRSLGLTLAEIQTLAAVYLGPAR